MINAGPGCVEERAGSRCNSCIFDENETVLPPLAERMRPQHLQDVLGQDHLSAAESMLFRALQHKLVPSMILWGPPGVGKTTLAMIIARDLLKPFYTLSAISSGVKDLRDIIEKAKGQDGVILFIDEIHRFNKSQQDALLGAVEKGIITLIGATTENPSFEVNSALLSRCQVFLLKPLQEQQLKQLIEQALRNDEVLKQRNIRCLEYDALLRLSGGDARKLFNLLEMVMNTFPEEAAVEITNKRVMDCAQQKVSFYDKQGEQHYDIISAFIKSMRGSDPNAAVYWLARMIEGGESLTFIARRMMIFASEDIGNANPNALLLAQATFQSVHQVGHPESRIILSQCAIYLATSVKSNASYMAIEKAISLVHQYGDLPVPLSIRNAPTKLMRDLQYGEGYAYDHHHENQFAGQEFLPEPIKETRIYEPGSSQKESEIRRFLKERWKTKYGY